jgi:predicted MFS family arabinose efflux permease
MLLVFAFSQTATWGWLNIKTVAVFLSSMALLSGFLFNESRVKRPLMPLSIFRIRNVRGANLIMAPLYASMLGAFFLLTLYIQGILGFSPLKTGLSFLPFPIVLALMSRQMPKLVQKYGFKKFLIAGPLIVTTGLLWLSRLHTGGTYWVGVLPAAIVMPLGIGMTIMPTIAAATSGVPRDEAGIASGLITTSQQMGGALGLSILSGIAASVTTSSIHLGLTRATLRGYHVAFLVDAAFMLMSALAAALIIHSPKQAAAEEADKASAARLKLQTSMNH